MTGPDRHRRRPRPADEPLAGAATAVFVVPDWPQAHQQLYVWTGLAAAVAYVTYAYDGMTSTWVRPVGETAAVLVNRPAAFDGDYATWHSAPLPTLTAYDAAGHPIDTVPAPRIAGDDMTISSAPPAPKAP